MDADHNLYQFQRLKPARTAKLPRIMPNAFLRKLAHGAHLTEADHVALARLTRRTRVVEPRRRLVDEGEPVARALIVLEGWACRSELLADDERMISDLLLPGDLCHVTASLLGQSDHTVNSVSRCTIAEVEPTEILEVLERREGAARALRWTTLQADNLVRQALINNGRRLAVPRIAHLICELRARLEAVGEPVEAFAWPLTQEELADVTGLTAVHVNRSLMELREQELIVQEKRFMRVLDPRRLAALCDFRPRYLLYARVLSA